MTQRDPQPTADDQANDERIEVSPVGTRLGAWWFPVLIVAVVASLWVTQSTALPGSSQPRTAILPPAPTPTEAATPEPAPPPELPSPTAAPLVQVQPEPVTVTLALPTVTPTSPQWQTVTRTVTFSGNATLRVTLENATFQTTGRPVNRPIEPRTYVLGAPALTVGDRWCMQMGVSSLLIDLTLTMDPATERVDAAGSLTLHNGFCDAPGEPLANNPILVSVPADASAELVQSMQAKTQLLGTTNLLDTSTGVFVELVIANTRPK